MLVTTLSSSSGGDSGAKKVRIGLVTDIGGLNDRSFNEAAYKGLKRAKSELGADIHIFFEVDAEPVIVEQALSDDEDEDATLLIRRDRALFTARVDPQTKARVGGSLRLAVDPAAFHYFDPATGLRSARAAAPALAGA